MRVAAWADWGAEKAAGYIDQSFLGHGAMMAATGVETSKCFAYSQLENSIHLIIPEADVERMLGGAGLMLGGGFKSFGGFMLALGSSTVSWAGIGVPGMAAGIFVAGAGASDMNQGAEEFFLGLSGDSTTQTRNGMSDLFYGGNDTIYHLSTGTAAMAGSMLTPYVNAQAAGTGTATATAGSTAGEPAATKPAVTEAAGETADDALEQFYDDIFESSYGEQFDPVREQAIAGSGEIAGESVIKSQGVGNPVIIEGKGNTGRIIPNTLNEQMAMHQVQSNPLEGATKVPIPMKDARWPATDGWIKMQVVVHNIDGTKTTIHYVYNEITGAFDDFKFK